MSASGLGTRRLVLVGGGRSHVEVLRRFAHEPPPNCRVTLVAPDRHSIYSGMVPGVITGRYRREQAEIDLASLAARAGAEFLLDEASGLDPAGQVLMGRARGPIPYDFLSLDTGSIPDLTVPGAAEHTLPLKPLGRFLDFWPALVDRVRERGRRSRIGIVGAGAGGVELALAIRAGLADVRPKLVLPELVLVGAGLVPGAPKSAHRRLTLSLVEAGVTLRLGVPVVAVEPGTLVLAEDSRIALDEILWLTQAASPAWLAASGLATDVAGFVAVDAYLRSVSHLEVFASGDVAAIAGQPRAKAGVFAVRQGPPLAENLYRALAGELLVPIRLQRSRLSLISTGDGRAVAMRGRWVFSGRLAWRLKDWIDRRWIARYKQPQDGAERGS